MRAADISDRERGTDEYSEKRARCSYDTAGRGITAGNFGDTSGVRKVVASRTLAHRVPEFQIFPGKRLIAVDCGEVEGGEADGDVLGSVGRRRAVADPFAEVGDDGLAGVDVDCSMARFDVQRSAEDDGELVEFGLLAGLGPT